MLQTLSVFPLCGPEPDCSNDGLVYRKFKENKFGGMMTLVKGTSLEILDWSLHQNSETLSNTLVVEQRELWGKPHWFARPFSEPLNRIRVFGGNFVYTSDSRFKEFTGLHRNLPLPVHDRYETQKEYDALSK